MGCDMVQIILIANLYLLFLQVSRMSQWDAPKDFKLDRNKEVKDATFGMSFYH